MWEVVPAENAALSGWSPFQEKLDIYLGKTHCLSTKFLLDQQKTKTHRGIASCQLSALVSGWFGIVIQSPCPLPRFECHPNSFSRLSLECPLTRTFQWQRCLKSWSITNKEVGWQKLCFKSLSRVTLQWSGRTEGVVILYLTCFEGMTHQKSSHWELLRRVGPRLTFERLIG